MILNAILFQAGWFAVVLAAGWALATPLLASLARRLHAA